MTQITCDRNGDKVELAICKGNDWEAVFMSVVEAGELLDRLTDVLNEEADDDWELTID